MNMEYFNNISDEIDKIGFKAYGKIIEIVFVGGVTHRFENVHKQIFDDFKSVDSKKDYYVDHIQNSDIDYDTINEGDEIDSKKILKDQQRNLITQFVDYNLRTLSELLEDDTINLHPEYQRRYRWNDERQSKLIESFIMNVPVPPIFLNEDEFGKYSVIDGKQRLHSIHRFLTNELELVGLKVFKDLNGKTFSDLPSAYQNYLKIRAVLRAIIILNESDEDIKFKVFRRLNTGGVSLNAQEIRNSAYPGDLNDLIIKLSENPTFHKLLGVDIKNESKIYQEMKDVEYVLRFFTFFENPTYFSGDIDWKMSNFIRENQKMDEIKIEKFEKKFLSTIRFIYRLFGEYAFKRWFRNRNRWKQKITTPLFDAVIFACVDRDDTLSIPNDFNQDDFNEEYKKLFSDEEYESSISYHTGTSPAFFKRKEKVYNLIKDTLER